MAEKILQVIIAKITKDGEAEWLEEAAIKEVMEEMVTSPDPTIKTLPQGTWVYKTEDAMYFIRLDDNDALLIEEYDLLTQAQHGEN